MEGYVTWEVTAVLKAAGAERPGVRFCHPSAGGIAQLGERLLCKQNVASSILVTSTSFIG